MSHEVEVDEIVAACGHLETVTLKGGEVLFREDDTAGSMYVVKRGVLRIVSGSTIYETVRAGGIVGEMAIIEENTPRSATVVAAIDAELFEIDIAKFLALVDTTPAFSIAVMRAIARRLRAMNRRYRTNTFD